MCLLLQNISQLGISWKQNTMGVIWNNKKPKNMEANKITCELVGSDDALDVPVWPEEVVVKDREREGVRGVLGLQHDMLVLAVKVGVGDVVLINKI